MYAKYALCALLAVIGLPAHAQQPAPAPGLATTPVPAAAPVSEPKPSREASEIAAINERLAVMTARLSELEMEAKIAAKRSEIRKAGEFASLSDGMFTPTVQEIGGIDGKITATLVVEGGNTQTVRVGDRVGVWRVISISSDSVTVQKGRDTLRLAFAVNAYQPQAPGATPPSGLPPFPAR